MYSGVILAGLPAYGTCAAHISSPFPQHTNHTSPILSRQMQDGRSTRNYNISVHPSVNMGTFPNQKSEWLQIWYINTPGSIYRGVFLKFRILTYFLWLMDQSSSFHYSREKLKWIYLITYLTYRHMVSTIEAVHLGPCFGLCQQWPWPTFEGYRGQYLE